MGRGRAPTCPVVGPGAERWIASVIGALLLVLLAPPARAASAPQPCAAGHVRLTFDDGPHPTATPRILDTLADRGAEATFFVTGEMTTARPEIGRASCRERV